jgi:hypothetical protein
MVAGTPESAVGMRPPATIYVAPHTYRLVMVPDGVMDDAGRFGHASIDRLVLALDDGQPPTQVADTLFHELGHALLASVGLEDDVEERVCLALGPGLLALHLNNPQLLEYIASLRR